MHELELDPLVDAAHIGVSVREAAVTLTGRVASYGEHVQALKAAERVYGVRAVADKLSVDGPDFAHRDDSVTAEAIAHALRWDDEVPDTLEAEIANGLVTLRGEAEWPAQVERARRVVAKVAGVRGVTSAATVRHDAG
jgi:osmotically-inducible protein OsmY